MQIKLEGQALVLGAKIDALYEETRKFQEELQEEFNKRWEAKKGEVDRRVHELEAEISTLIGVDLKGDYVIDGTYFEEHGLMFVVDSPEKNAAGDIGSLVQRLMQEAVD